METGNGPWLTAAGDGTNDLSVSKVGAAGAVTGVGGVDTVSVLVDTAPTGSDPC